MKSKVILVSACLGTMVLQAGAQTQYDAVKYSGNELNGTARFVGMGGAMGALGADISVIGTNPAGIGLFRGHDISTSFGFNATKTESDFGGNTMNDKRARASFDQIGFVYSSKIGNRTTLRYVNFGFNYHKSRNFNKLFAAGGFLDGLSQTQQIANLMGGSIYSIDEIDAIYNYSMGGDKHLRNPYDPVGSNYPYLGVMGVRMELVGVGTFEDDKGTFEAPIGWGGDASGYRSREEGGINQYDFNVSFNVEDRMYFGVTLGVYDINYTRSTYYTEDIYDGNHLGFYELWNAYRTDGSGIDLKLGAIFRPVEDSPFRFGLAVHTPVWYTLTDIYSSALYSNLEYHGVDAQGNPSVEYFEGEEHTSDYVGETVQDYQLSTPWKFNVSAGTTIGGRVALGAEYEYADYASARLRYSDGAEMENQNSYLRSTLKGVHTLRLGAEARVAPSWSVRAGYNFTSSIFKKDAYKSLNWNDMRTDTEYANDFGRHTATVGLGWRGSNFYADIAYKYDFYKSDFYAFSAEALQATKVNTDRHQLLLTFGIHF